VAVVVEVVILPRESETRATDVLRLARVMVVAAPVIRFCLLLKVVQSAADRAPGAEAEAVSRETTWLARERPLEAPAARVTGL
jgi:hypothetical protein